MATWTRQPQEREGTYFFAGTLYVTNGVQAELPMSEIMMIFQDTQFFAQQNGGIDYLLVYTNEAGRKLFFIDQLNREMIASGRFEKEDNYCTLLWSHEY